HAQPADPADAAAVGFLDAGQHLEQGGLAATVEADDADPLTRVHAQGDVIEQRFDPETLADLFEVDQVGHETFPCLAGRYSESAPVEAGRLACPEQGYRVGPEQRSADIAA